MRRVLFQNTTKGGQIQMVHGEKRILPDEVGEDYTEREVRGMSWYVYMLRCKDDTLYTGMTDDVERRLEAHRAGRGAKYTRGRGPLELVYREEQPDKSSALRREIQLKKPSRQEKLALCRSWEKGE